MYVKGEQGEETNNINWGHSRGDLDLLLHAPSRYSIHGAPIISFLQQQQLATAICIMLMQQELG